MKRTKRILSILLTFVLVVAMVPAIDITAFAETTDDGFEYEINESNEITITGYSGSATELIIPSEINGYPVTCIGEYALAWCDTLVSVTIPNSVIYIGDYSFYRCYSLISVIIPDGVTSIGERAFCDCYLSSLTIPNSVTTIGEYSFSLNYNLTTIVIPDNVTHIGTGAFVRCSSLTAITVDDNNPNYCSVDGVFFNKDKTNLLQYPSQKQGTSYTIPKTVTSIGCAAFEDCNNLETIEIPDSVTFIDEYAFQWCSSLKSITIPESATHIGSGAFYGCSDLLSITIPDGIKNIGECTFERCSALKTVNLPNSIVNIGENAFYYCYDLSSITIPNGVTSIGKKCFESCHDLKEIILPDSVIDIGNRAFYGCRLTTITIPTNVKNIGYNAFADCNYLTTITVNDNNLYYSSLYGILFNKDKTELIQYPEGKTSTLYTIPDSVTSIGNCAFENCSSLTSITVPNSVTSIGSYAFHDCYSLTSITLPDSVTSIDKYAFYSCDSLTDVYYTGTQTQWEEISIGSSNSCLTDANIHFETGDNHYEIKSSIEPTCIEGGSTTYQCPCGYEKTVEVPASGHKDVNGICSICGTRTFEYEINESNEITITGYSGSATELIIPSEINGYPVTCIGEYAFAERGITTDGVACSITIPTSITDIGEYAFAMSAITSITVDENNPNYCSVDGVLFNKEKTELIQYPTLNEKTTYTIPDSVTNIGGYAFCFSQFLTSVTIPDSVTSIEEGAFMWCEALTLIIGGSNLTNLGNSAFEGTAYIEDENNYVDGIMYLGSILLKADNKYLPDKCSILSGTKVISSQAFYNCYNLNEITIPDTVIHIGDMAFANCTGLSSVQIPESVTEIGYCNFMYCRGLTSITVDKNNSNYCSVDGVLFTKDQTELIQYPANKKDTLYEIPDGVKRIGDFAFCVAYSLETIALPDTVTDIGPGSFDECHSLMEITLPDTVTKIGALAFNFCESLTTINIPCNVETIGYMPKGIYASFLGSDTILNSCDSLLSITVDESNKNFCSIDGVLFNKDQTKLIQYPIGKTDASYIIPSGVTTIADETFYRCNSLTEITIPNSVTNIGNAAFRRLESLNKIYYIGSEEQWNAIEISWNNDILDYVEIHFIQNIDINTSTDTALINYNDTLTYNVESESATYQWYGCNNEDRSDAVAILNATSTSFVPFDFFEENNQYGKYKYYYCLAYESVNGITVRTESPLCTNALSAVSKTYYSEIDYSQLVIRSDSTNNVNDFSNIVELGEIQGVTFTVTPSHSYGNTKSYGTGSQLIISNNEGYETVIDIIVYGDTNGDGVIDVLDVSDISDASTQMYQLSGLYNDAADINGDGTVDVLDYQAAVNKALQ